LFDLVDRRGGSLELRGISRTLGRARQLALLVGPPALVLDLVERPRIAGRELAGARLGGGELALRGLDRLRAALGIDGAAARLAQALAQRRHVDAGRVELGELAPPRVELGGCARGIDRPAAVLALRSGDRLAAADPGTQVVAERDVVVADRG